MRTNALALIAIVFALAAPAQEARAASLGTLTLTGTVPPVNELTVAENGNNNTELNITGGETSKNVATVTESSNNGTGYQVHISSASGGFLRNTANVAHKTQYQVSYDGGPFTQPSTTSTSVKNSGAIGGLTTNSSVVLVKVTALPNAPAGVYNDVVTLTIVANP